MSTELLPGAHRTIQKSTSKVCDPTISIRRFTKWQVLLFWHLVMIDARVWTVDVTCIAAVCDIESSPFLDQAYMRVYTDSRTVHFNLGLLLRL